MFTEEPGRDYKSGNQPSGKNPAGLQRIQRKYLAEVIAEGSSAVPLKNDVQNLRADNPRKHHGDAQVPGILRLNSLSRRISNADPEPYQNSESDQHAVGRNAKTADLKESGKHFN
jgi:hypothetical protein